MSGESRIEKANIIASIVKRVIDELTGYELVVQTIIGGTVTYSIRKK